MKYFAVFGGKTVNNKPKVAHNPLPSYKTIQFWQLFNIFDHLVHLIPLKAAQNGCFVAYKAKSRSYGAAFCKEDETYTICCR